MSTRQKFKVIMIDFVGMMFVLTFVMVRCVGAASIIDSGTSEPADPVTGQEFYRTDFHAHEIYDGEQWIQQEIGVFNVKAFGAKGDGIADDTAAIQAVLDYICNSDRSGGTSIAYFPRGIYKISATLIWRPDDTGAPTRIMGAGSIVTSIAWYGLDGGTMIQKPRRVDPSTSDHWMQMEGLRLLGKPSTNQAAIGIDLEGCSSAIFRDIVIEKVSGRGFDCDLVLDTIFEKIIIEGDPTTYMGTGIYLNSDGISGPRSCNNNTFINCQLGECVTGIHDRYNRVNTYLNCDFHTNNENKYGLFIEHGLGHTIQSYFEGSSNYLYGRAIYVTGSQGVRVVGSNLSTDVRPSIQFDACSDAYTFGNVYESSNDYEVEVTNDSPTSKYVLLDGPRTNAPVGKTISQDVLATNKLVVNTDTLVTNEDIGKFVSVGRRLGIGFMTEPTHPIHIKADPPVIKFEDTGIGGSIGYFAVDGWEGGWFTGDGTTGRKLIIKTGLFEEMLYLDCSAGRIYVGPGDSHDTNLYRAEADTLKTDDLFVAGGGLKVDVVTTDSLPAAGPSQDGRILIEDAGAGNRNLIIYVGGERFRIDGGAAF